MKEYDAYLFDADGTILDTRELIYHSFLAIEKELGFPLPSRDRIQETVGLPFDRQLRLVVGGGHDEAFYERAAAAYRAHMMDSYQADLKAFPGAKEVLARLHGAGKKLAVVSSRRLNSLERFLESTGLLGFFELLVTPESTSEHKPHPAPALLAMEKLAAAPDKTVFVGDATFDIECGKAAGTDAVLVSWGGMDPSEWAVQPDAVVDDFYELLPARLQAGSLS